MIFPGQLVSMFLIFIACSEYLRMLSIRYTQNGFWLAYVWLFLQFFTYFFPQFSLSVRYDKDIYILLVLVAIEAALWGKTAERWIRASLLFSGLIFLSIAAFSMLAFYQDPFQKIFPMQYNSMFLSELGIVTVCSAVFLCDTAAYFKGTAFGIHQFSSTSPRKTVEGAIAGLLAALIVSMIGWWFWADPRYPRVLGIALGLIIGIFAPAGDLLVSVMKRYYQVKDASDIFPGHGGVLDRFDSLFFTAPILSVFFVLVDRIW
jgi:phosphatidate cytidylyltransferase